MTDEINDYAPALLKIKAAIKELESALPAGRFVHSELVAAQITKASWDLRIELRKLMQKAA